MDYKAIVQELCDDYDEQLKRCVSLAGRHIIHLVGNPDTSYFIRSMDKRLRSYGFRVQNHYPDFDPHEPGTIEEIAEAAASYVIYDTDDPKVHPNWRPSIHDADSVLSGDVSSCATAIYQFLKACDMIRSKNITIIGRGHAVKGLPKLLLDEDGTPTVCHSRSPRVRESCTYADVTIVATPRLETSVAASQLVLDISGAAKDRHNCWDYFAGVGKLTQLILCYRCL